MAIIKFNSVDGFSVGTSETTIIDGSGNISAVGATFSGQVSIGGLGITSIVSSVNGVTGAVSIAQGSNVTVNTSGNTITISSSSGGGSSPPLATNSLTGVASFSREFSVSLTGTISLTGNLVTSFNGATGAVQYSPRIATTSLTGVASFNSSYFTVDGLGAASLASGYQVTGDTVVAGARTSITRSGNSVTIGDNTPVASSSVTGVASFNASDFSVSALGDVTLSNVARTNSTNTFTGLQTFNAGITTQSLFVAQGATFNGVPAWFGSGLTTQSLFVAQGATFNSSITLGGLGVTSIVSSVNGVTGAVSIAQGSNVTVNTSGNTITISSNGGGGSSPLATTTGITGVASFNSNHFSVSLTGTVSITGSYQTSIARHFLFGGF